MAFQNKGATNLQKIVVFIIHFRIRNDFIAVAILTRHIRYFVPASG